MVVRFFISIFASINRKKRLMMTKKKQITLALATVLFSACSSTPKQETKDAAIIDLSEVEYSTSPQPLSDFVESIEYIKLSEEPLVADAILTRLSEDKKGNLYLYVPGGLFKYAPDGTFIKNLIKVGQGPNEICHKVRMLTYKTFNTLAIIP